ncbi:MAG: flagellar biosynthetic protein FliO [Acetobacteraceae bacterium]|nr:flagellar biosynthetic protein FliO [Acetobacteraceae bacterium]
MTIPTGTWLLAAALLAGIVALLLLLARGARRFGLAPAAGRRLKVEEVLPLDSRRRLLIVRCDGREALLLTGGSQDVVVGWL